MYDKNPPENGGFVSNLNDGLKYSRHFLCAELNIGYFAIALDK